MTKIHTLVVSVALVTTMAAPVSAATTDPEVIIYRFTGMRDDGSAANAGVATVFNCTNFSGVPENIRMVSRDLSGTLLSNALTTVAHLSSVTASTHATNAYVIEVPLSTGSVSGGTMAIAATSINIICTAMAIDASTTVPVGVALRGIRFSPIPGSQE